MRNKIIKALLSVLLVTALLCGVVYAYRALTSIGQVEVQEALSFVGESTFDVSLFPQESQSAQLTIANASSVAMDVDLLSEVIPDPGAKGLTVDIPAKITVPATGQIVVDIVITAGKSAEPQVYSVSIFFDR